MLNEQPDEIGAWTEDGRDDGAAEVGLVLEAHGGIRVSINAPKTAITYVALRWRRALPAGVRILGDAWERGYGDLEWRGVAPERPLPWYALVHDQNPFGETTWGLGVETGAGSMASWRVDEAGVTLVLDVRCGGLGVQLGSRTLHAATLREMQSVEDETPFAFARRFCQLLCPNPRLPKQPVYGGNDWYSRYGNITAETVRQDAALIRELSPEGNNPPTVVIDAGWYPTDAHDGAVYDRGNAGFPDLPGLAAWMRGIGVRPGIWIRPLLVQEDAPQSWRVGREHPLAKTPGVYLDPSVPEVLARVREDVARLSGWGYELVKQDFTTYDITGRWGFEMNGSGGVTRDGWAFADRSRTTAEVISALYGAIREGAGAAQVIGCNTVGHLAAGLFELQRTGDDTSGRHWERTRKMGINTLAFRMPQQETFFVADADCVGLRPDISWEQNRQWLDVLARSGTALFVSALPEAVGPEQRAALREAFAIAALPQAPGEPLDWLETACPRRWRFGGASGETRVYDWQTFPGAAFGCPP